MKKVYVNEPACMGCRLCEVYCRLKHSRSRDLVKAFKSEFPAPISRVRVDENGVVSLSVRCQHCADAPCIPACLTGALSRDPATRLVNVDEEKCIACGTCALVCPFGVPRLDTAQKRMVKCDLCQDEQIPVCVANCPNEALVFAEVPDESPTAKTRAAARSN
ncbi:MAG TPA: 4Fe-4S dicluster domain-containing protein [Dehalococcoidales bacterium]|nr:4Fe-4S dicluster domain-containing protein [Dehalococcoidales bacterium]